LKNTGFTGKMFLIVRIKKGMKGNINVRADQIIYAYYFENRKL